MGRVGSKSGTKEEYSHLKCSIIVGKTIRFNRLPGEQQFVSLFVSNSVEGTDKHNLIYEFAIVG